MLINFSFSDIISMPLWDTQDTFQFMFRFALHLGLLLVIVRYLYFEASKRKDYLFTYILISMVIFLLCYMLENVKLELGMALGLFAVFGIIRYRTSQIPIREMTYLFIVIGLAVINALANKKISFTELLLANAAIFFVTYILEKVWSLKHVSRKVIQYDNVNLIHPDKYDALVADLEARLGLDITKVEVGRVDFLRDTAKLVVYYNTASNTGNLADELESFEQGGGE